MSEVKPHLSYEGKINKLREKGFIIADDSFCESILVNIGYYLLSAYFLPFKNKDGKTEHSLVVLRRRTLPEYHLLKKNQKNLS